MKWIHEFYQRNPDDSNGFYYFSQRRAWAILESVKEIAPNLPTEQVESWGESLIDAYNAVKTFSLENLKDERGIDVSIARLRKKIEDDSKNPQYLRTIRNQGYVLYN